MNTFRFRRIFCISLTLVATVTVQATTFTVDTLADENDGPGVGAGTSLRDAITSANENLGPHTINFAPALTGSGPVTHALQSALPAIKTQVSLLGPGSNLLSISANNTTRVLEIATDTTVTIQNLALRDGLTTVPVPVTGDGGGLLVSGALTISDCIITSCTAVRGAGIFLNTTSTLDMTRCDVSQNLAIMESGGIRHASTGIMKVKDSSIRNNSAVGFAGGLDLFTGTGPVEISRSTIVANTAGLGAGGIYTNQPLSMSDSTISGNQAITTVSAGGGGIMIAGTTATLVNSTISGNSTSANGGGILITAAPTTTTIQNVTITGNTADVDGNILTGNGGGISVTTSPLILANTVISGNTDTTTDGLVHPDLSGTVISAGHNFIGIGEGSGGVSTGSNGDEVGTTSTPLIAGIGPLANNGGPTRTHQPLPGSPLIDTGTGILAAPFAVPPTDQRGYPRFRGAAIDKGAVETQPIPGAFQDDYITMEDVGFVIAAPGVLFNDTDYTSAVLNATTAHGVLVLSGDGSFSYTPAENFFGSDSFTYRASNALNELSNIATVNISVTPVNDGPHITAPVGITTPEDTALTITGISVADVDAGIAGIQVNLAVSHGTLNVAAGPAAVTGNGTGIVQLTGTVAAINTRLAGLVYTPGANYNGPETLGIDISDLGNTGIGGTLTDILAVGIDVTPVSDARLQITKTAQTESDSSGTTITYTVITTNTGSETTSGPVVIRDTPAAALSFINASGTAGTVGVEITATSPFYQVVDTVAPLAPAASEVLTLIFFVNGTNSYLNTATATSWEGSVSASATVNLCPAANRPSAGSCSTLPDLAVSFTVPAAVNKTKLKAKTLVTNNGSVDAIAVPVNFVLSSDNCPTGADLAMATKLLKKLKPGKSKKVTLSFKLLDPASVSGKTVVFSADPDNLVDECNEQNNLATSGPLP